MEKKNVNAGWELDGMPDWVVLILLSPSMFLLGKFFIVPCYDWLKELGFIGIAEISKDFTALLLDYIPAWILIPTLLFLFFKTLRSMFLIEREDI